MILHTSDSYPNPQLLEIESLGKIVGSWSNPTLQYIDHKHELKQGRQIALDYLIELDCKPYLRNAGQKRNHKVVI